MIRKTGRPRRYDERVDMKFRCPPDLKAAIEESAGDHDVSWNLWLERAARRYLAELGTPAREETATPPWSWDDKRRR